MTSTQQAIPVWLVQGDQQTEVGTAVVAYDPDTCEARVTLSATGEDNAGTEHPARECFLVVEHLPQEDGNPGQVLAFPLGDYQVAGLDEHPAQMIPRKAPQGP